MSKWILAVVVGLGVQSGALIAGEPKKDDKKIEEKKDEKKKDPKDMNADEAQAAGLCPVSKKEFKPVYHADYKEKTYNFCSRNCQKEFAANPVKYVKEVKK